MNINSGNGVRGQATISIISATYNVERCLPALIESLRAQKDKNFEWVVEAVSDMAIRKAREHNPGRDHLSWGKFIQAGATGRALSDLA